MIQQIFAAPKKMDDATGLGFAVDNELGYEIPGFMSPRVLESPDEALTQWKERLRSLKGARAIHGPVYDMNPVSLDPAIREVTLSRYARTMELARDLECRFVIFHSQWEPLYKTVGVNKEWFAQTVDFWREFAETHLSKPDGMTMVIENFMEETPDQLRMLVDAIDHPAVKACLDTGHANLYSKALMTHWLDTLEHQLIYIHGHNNHGELDEHRGFKYGTVDMEGFLNHLIHQPYKMSLALEIFHAPELQDSLDLVWHYFTMQQEQAPEKSFLI